MEQLKYLYFVIRTVVLPSNRTVSPGVEEIFAHVDFEQFMAGASGFRDCEPVLTLPRSVSPDQKRGPDDLDEQSSFKSKGPALPPKH